MLLTLEEFRAFQPKRETFALFGWPLGHTMSPALHAALFEASERDAAYIAVAVPPEDFSEAFALAKQKLHGINLTIPHKKAVIPLLDDIDPAARDLHSVNTVAFRNGKATGYNTDILGFAASLTLDDVSLANKKVLLIGYGGAAAVMAYHCIREGAWLTITGRSAERGEALIAQLLEAFPHGKASFCLKKNIPKDIQIVINGTPVGMYPQENACPLRYLPRRCEYVFDAIYNPPNTALLLLPHGHKTKTRDGLYMLVMQAAHAQTIWTGASFEQSACTRILRRLYGQMAVKRLHDKYHKQNIALCGFMGSGKTTVGRKLARICGMQNIDSDHYLENQEGRKISDIFAENGEEVFRDLETHYIDELTQRENIVLSLGGGAILRPENVALIKRTCLLIHLDTPFYRIVKNLSYSNSRPLLEQGDKMTKTRKLYQERKDVYRAVADCSVRSPRLSELIERVLKSI